MGIKLLGGDFGEKEAILVQTPGKPLTLRIVEGFLKWTDIPVKDQIERVEIQTEESLKKLSVGWGLAGGLLFGPLGALAGFVLGGKKKKEICFACYLKDGHKFLAITDSKTFQKLRAAIF